MNRRKPLWIDGLNDAFILLIGLLLIYVLSYAPVEKHLGWEIRSERIIENGEPRVVLVVYSSVVPPIYDPVDRLSSHPSLKTPLLAWAALWGVEERLERRLN